MPTLTITKGLPASGKTTWAKKAVGVKRVNKDDLRAMIDNGKWSKENEKFILKVRDYIVDTALAHGTDVIVDDTNLAPKHEENLRKMAEAHGAEFVVKDFTDVSLKECLKRDAERPNSVGEQVIRTMYNSFIRKKGHVAQYIPPPFNPDLPKCIIVDIDGTLAHSTGRNMYDLSRVHEDAVDETVRDIVRKYNQLDEAGNPEHYAIIVSGRQDSSYGVTLEWLADNNIPYDEIYMRKTGDERKDSIVKQEIYEEWIKPRYNVTVVLDDRNQVVEMWRAQGLKVLQVADGDF